MLPKKTQWRMVLTLCITLIFVVGGCAKKQDERIGLQAPAPARQSAAMLVAGESAFSDVRVYRETNGRVWVPLEETAKSMNLDLHSANPFFTLGNTDAIYTVKMNQTQALAGDNPIELPQAPGWFANKPYMTTQALSKLLGTKVNWNAQNSQVVITPINDRLLSGRSASRQPATDSTGQTRLLSLTAADKSDLIRFAKTFIGTPYKFGSGPYEKTHTFDCSSFVQYVYAHFGVDLPRSSRSQAQVGQTVDVNQLEPGDLLFFYTPGRFASNRIVGHVAIYTGDGQIIHTYGDPGVTVTDFSEYWRNRFLFAKRVV